MYIIYKTSIQCKIFKTNNCFLKVGSIIYFLSYCIYILPFAFQSRLKNQPLSYSAYNIRNPLNDQKPPTVPPGNVGMVFLNLLSAPWGWQYLYGILVEKIWLIFKSMHIRKMQGFSQARVVCEAELFQSATSKLFWAVCSLKLIIKWSYQLNGILWTRPCDSILFSDSCPKHSRLLYSIWTICDHCV